MKTLQSIIQILQKHEEKLKGKYKIKTLKIFGSYAVGKQTESSDLDVIVTFKEAPTLLEFLSLKEYIENLVKLKVDLVTENAISPYIRPHLKEVEVLNFEK
ncbi:nucleotidyltransferase family protein [Phorcysia thermohydrogeniphila]|uniref:Polymerase nucleotidyl transferase domain-containing protein n=1 Tax=Phorcysia thermohydrogeniphila TaxID=936138 RepID=A0A4V2PCT2_9BACT|nr:nucleotidyltransferase family protein [Phorcysia thermohydrogeniphila]TCK02516.1 hypothetical protein CLV27_1693 [Phorcysia thermohydrogeniphila]